ncbi:MAG: SpoIVB peptidase [Candidatus Heteroscillospira sp.]|jgi:stage IV sporulation protein B
MKKANFTIFFALMLTLILSTAAAAAELIPGGMTVGLELKVRGVMVSRLLEVDTHDGKVSPAGEAGIRPGDCIVSLAGAEIQCGEDFTRRAAGLDGDTVSLTLRRDGQERTLSITPAQNKSGVWQLGMLLRDGAAGIGTVTYYDPVSGQFGALGHGVNDMDSGLLLPAEQGLVSPSVVVDIIPGKAGTPGELCGIFDSGETLGAIDSNTAFGIFGTLERFPGGDMVLETAEAGQVQPGKATILSNIKGTSVEEYEIELTRVNCSAKDGKCFVLKITDERLLKQTGGVICGMSGSPILQNGRLIGAVTHVLVNDPTRGYGIFIDKMLEAAA